LQQINKSNKITGYQFWRRKFNSRSLELYERNGIKKTRKN